MTEPVLTALIGAASGLFGAFAGAWISWRGVRAQLLREEQLDKERRAAEIIAAVEKCGFTLITGLGVHMTADLEVLLRSQEEGEDPNAIAARRDAIIQEVRDKGLMAQEELAIQKAYARLFIGREFREKIVTYSDAMKPLLADLIDSFKTNLQEGRASLPAVRSMPSWNAYNTAMIEVYESLDVFLGTTKSSSCHSCCAECGCLI